MGRKWSLDRKLETSKRNYARRCYKQAPLLAILLIRERYPDYSERDLLEHLKTKGKSKKKAGKAKEKRDFRTKQLKKYEVLYYTTDPSTKAFDKICHTIAQFTEALNQRRPITIHVKTMAGKCDYFFSWKTAEQHIKEFITMANIKGITHDQLAEKQAQIQKITAGLLAG